MSTNTEKLVARLQSMLPWFDYFIERSKNKPGGYQEDLKKNRAIVVEAIHARIPKSVFIVTVRRGTFGRLQLAFAERPTRTTIAAAILELYDSPDGHESYETFLKDGLIRRVMNDEYRCVEIAVF